ncbi:hypothetical protein [Pleomorphomonas carboxyditropha]|uniref:Uncharacterized protein n=1 Tax=Pleomorphomonas carboxyditropha TaxID=2023338 RepID=A0A2G9WRI0_9HYPH|nr:hypothetical protein [Pleomorphomonas carboxyditropha]PIO97293.1 hypothetical protein CJ014_21015 [Pleomorphomonas carboxyditropha]
MTTADVLLRASPAVRRSATVHIFKVGELVLLKPSFQYASAAGVYRITAILPWSEGQPQYRIQSDEERYERVAPQDSLERATASASGDNSRAMLVKRTFGHRPR